MRVSTNEETLARGGPTRAHSMTRLTDSLSPCRTASTDPSPATRWSIAFFCSAALKETPWTLPWTRILTVTRKPLPTVGTEAGGIFIPTRPPEGMSRLRQAIDDIVYATVCLGFVLLYVANGVVPGWLLASLFFGVFLYGLAALAVIKRYPWAYYLVMALAVLVLAVSLPQPEHYAFATNGEALPFLVFALGGAMQVALLILIPVYIRRSRSAGGNKADAG